MSALILHHPANLLALTDIAAEGKAAAATYAEAVGALGRNIQRAAGDVTVYLRFGRKPVLFYRLPDAGEAVGEITMTVDRHALPAGRTWHLLNPHTPPAWLPYGRIIDWLLAIACELPLIAPR
jgi:hypothetical protein